MTPKRTYQNTLVDHPPQPLVSSLVDLDGPLALRSEELCGLVCWYLHRQEQHKTNTNLRLQHRYQLWLQVTQYGQSAESWKQRRYVRLTSPLVIEPMSFSTSSI